MLKAKIKEPSDFLNPLLSKRGVENSKLDQFRASVKSYLEALEKQHIDKQSEPNIVSNALKPFFESLGYKAESQSQSGQSGIDLALKKDDQVSVIIEAKKHNSKEMITKDDLHKKSLYEAILYFFRERSSGNRGLFHIIITDFYSWFVFDAREFDTIFWSNSRIRKLFDAHQSPSLLGNTTAEFYSDLDSEIKKLRDNLIDDKEITCTHFNLKEEISDKKLTSIYTLLDKETLYKEFNPNDANKLNHNFYNELLYILGLTEKDESGKKLITRANTTNSIYENIENKLNQYGKSSDFEIVVGLMIVWLNRILFLKLLESQLISWSDDKSIKFLTTSKIDDFDKLEMLFFEILAKKPSDRKTSCAGFDQIPYLNSSLFDIHPLEDRYLKISNLQDSLEMDYFARTVLKDINGNKKSGKASTLEYLFEFLDAYSFGETEADEAKTLINSSVLGLVFEKLNGYKDGSFYTPSFITNYMARETLEALAVEKFSQAFELEFANINELIRYSEQNSYRDEFVEKANLVMNSITVCDPAVGSGHYLVSMLNEIIHLKHRLGLITMRNMTLSHQNDELLIRLDDEWFDYKRSKNQENPSQKLQKMIFKEKQKIIENSLFGVDINPNSVNICRLRLWIELLKHAYYREDGTLETLPNIDINIKSGNSLISRFGLKDEIRSNNIKHEIQNYKNAVKSYKYNLGSKKEILESIKNLKDMFRTSLKAEWKAVKTRDEKLKSFVANYGWDKLDDTLAMISAKRRYGQTNSLFGDDLDETKQAKALAELNDAQAKVEEIESGKIYENAFEWRFEFPEVLDDDGNFIGFDIVIGNPPYIRVQGLKDGYENETKFYEERFASATRNYDIYVLFMEQNFALLNRSGRLSFILPHKFLIADFGVGIRGFLHQNRAAESLLHFGSEMVFAEASTYTCIITLSHNNETLRFKSIKPQEIAEEFTFDEISYTDLSSDKWHLSDQATSKVLAKLNEQPLRVKDVFSKIFQGIATSGDNVYMLLQTKNGLYSKSLDQVVEIESGLIKPMLKGEDISRYKHLQNNYFVIFPYIIDSGKATPMSEDFIKENYPKGYEYLKANEKFLRGRERGRFDNPKEWFLFSRKQGIDFVEQQKIITPEIAFGANMTLDLGTFYHNTKCYSFIKKDDVAEDYKFYLALLNSSLMWFFIKNTGYELRGGYFTFKTAFLEPFPLPKLANISDQEAFIKLADQMLELNKKLQETKEEFLGELYLEKISKKLQDFELLDFDQFVSEYTKAKKSKTADHPDQTTFETAKAETLKLKELIRDNDQEINSRVYKLYDLTDEEIAIIETS